MNTGHPSLGSWISYGLGSLNENLPTFVVLTSKFRNMRNLQALSSRLWSAGFLPSRARGLFAARLGRPGVVPDRSRRRGPRRAPRDARRRQRAQRPGARAHRRPGNRDAHRGVRDGVPDADRRAGTDRSFRRTARRPTNSTASRRRNPARSPRTACWRAGWPSAACASCRFSIAAGTSIPTCPTACGCNARTWTRAATA